MDRPLFTLSKLLGGLPFNLDKNNSSWTDYMLVILVPIIYTGSYIYYIFYLIDAPKDNNCITICSIIENFYLHIGVLTYFFITTRITTKKSFLLKFQYIVGRIDDELKRCTEGNLELPRQTRFQIIFLSIGCILFLIGIIYNTYFIIATIGRIFLLMSFCTIFPFLMACVSQSQYVGLVHEIALRFDDLNGILETISEEADSRCDRLKVFDIESELNEKSSSTTITTTTTTVKNDQNEQKDKGKDTERFLVDAFKLHDKLCDISVLINDEYSVEIVSYMTSTFIITVLGIFLETKVIFIVGGQNRYFDFLSTSYVVWAVIFLLVGYMILRLSCRVMRESKRSALLVHEIMQKKPAFMLGNDIHYNRMKGFTLQYLHWESYFYFNGIGLFPLDYTFIFSAISAATSYLIVLLQFDLNEVK